MGHMKGGAGALLWALLLQNSCSDAKPADGAGAGGNAVAGETAQAKSGSSSMSVGGAGSSTGGFADFAAAYCASARACCTKNGLDMSGLSDCETEALRQFNIYPALERGTARTLEPHLANCVAALVEMAESCLLSSEILQECEQAFVGTLQSGGECANVIDCQRDTPTACIKIRKDGADQTPALGVCRPLTRGKLGDACLISVRRGDTSITYTTSGAEPPTSFCDASDALYCGPSSRKCESQTLTGAFCDFDEQCATGQVCAGNCQPEKPVGDACASASECESSARCLDGQCAPGFGSEKLCGGDLN